MADFLDVEIETDPTALVDDSIDQLASTLDANGFPGWAPADGNLEIILLKAVAQMAATVASSAAQVPASIFRAFGTKLLNLPYSQGAAATVVTTWTLADTDGHTIPGGTYVTISGLGFYVEADVVVDPGSSTAAVLLLAAEIGTLYNGLTGPIEPIDQIDWVQSIAITGSTSGGADPQDDTDYQNKLAAELALQARRPITADDYAAMALTVPSTVVPSGVVVGRATAIDGYDPAVHTFTANRASGSPTLSSVSSFTGVTAGTALSGTGIPSGITVLSTNPGAGTLTMSANASSTATGMTVTATGSYGNARTVTTFVTDPEGLALSSPAMTAISDWLASYREINFLAYVVAPTYTPVYVTFQIRVLPGFDPTATLAAAEQAGLNYLNPATWGGASPSNGGNQWLNSSQGFNIVRYNKLLGIIEAVPGVDYVPPGATGLAIGTSPSPTATVDLTLPGPAPLPESDLTTPTIVGSVV
jgi:Baseplate J-like protein